MRKLTIALALGISLISLSQEATPDLTGIWRCNLQKSHLNSSSVESMRLKIEQRGDDLTITLGVVTGEGEEMQTFHYRVGSDDNQSTMHGAPMRSSAEWTDAGLKVDSVAKFPDGDLLLNNLWTLSADGRTLTVVEQHKFGHEPGGTSTMVYEKQDDGVWGPPAKARPAEQVFKNIRVLKGLPANELRPTMRSFARSLGVRCEFCHDTSAFEKDLKPQKQTARQMIAMAMKIDQDNFGGKLRVTCWTCHHGASKPESDQGS